ncbi:MAG TPA: FUN14 domain-containing protein [Planctomycetota bacterium]|nr:FUN14 domain-containing protein [Planctomycetota bacterium]
MTEPRAHDREHDTQKPTLWQRFARQATWKKLLLILGLVLVVLGAVFQVLAWMDPPAPVNSQGSGLGNSFDAGSGTGGVAAQSSEAAWSEGFFKLGFSFFAGFAIGSFVRGFLKVFVFFAGGLLLVLFALDYFEVAPINWSLLDSWFDTARDKIIGETNSFRDFISSRLPSGGLGALGLFAGFKKS